MEIPASRLPHPLQVLLWDGRRQGSRRPPASCPRLPPSGPEPSPGRGPFPAGRLEGPARLAPLMTRSVVERWRFLPDMVPSASSRSRRPPDVRLRLRLQRSRLPGAGQSAVPRPGSSGRPRHQKEAAAAAQPRTPRTGCGPTGRSLLRRGVASARDRS